MSDKVRVYEVAEESGATSTEVILKAKDLNIVVKSPQSQISFEGGWAGEIKFEQGPWIAWCRDRALSHRGASGGVVNELEIGNRRGSQLVRPRPPAPSISPVVRSLGGNPTTDVNRRRMHARSRVRWV